MTSDGTTRVGIIGTSWWADSMYLPALEACEGVELTGVAGRNHDRAVEFADRWSIGTAHADAQSLLDSDLDAVVIASANDSHHPLALAAIERGLHVLCEKPLGLNDVEAQEMASAATAAGVTTLVPFTYRYMPMMRWVKQLLDDGYVGEARHLSMRYFTGYARDGEYAWRFDRGEAGSGVIGDIGSHWLAIALWLLGDPTSVSATSVAFVPRGPRPDGEPYEAGEDSAVMTLGFANGTYAVLHVSAVCWEGGDFNQTHWLDLHGTDGTLYAHSDWQEVQAVRGVKAGMPGPAADLPIPDHIWGGARRDTVHNTYRDTFRDVGAMIGEFIDAARQNAPCEFDFTFGARVQELCDAAVRSASSGGTPVAV